MRAAIIYLGRRLPAASSGLPEGLGRAAPGARGSPIPRHALCLALLPVGFA